jgi:hypothetical protein
LKRKEVGFLFARTALQNTKRNPTIAMAELGMVNGTNLYSS